MSKLSKGNRQNLMFKSSARALTPSQLLTQEKSQLNLEHGFTPEAAQIAVELSSSTNKYNQLKAKQIKMPRSLQLLEEKIRHCIKQLQDLNYSVEDLGNGTYFVKPNDILAVRNRV